MRIGAHEIGGDHPVFVIAEIGINHGGSLDTALKMIDAANAAGADAVKFQKRTVDLVYSEAELAKPRESPFGTTNGDLKRGLELTADEYDQIADHCDDLNIAWLASPWDVESVVFLTQFNMPAWKIPSALVTDIDLIKAVSFAANLGHASAEDATPIIISTGMSTEQEILQAVLAAKRGLFNSPIALMVCTASYPAEPEDLNLRRILTAQRHYPSFPIGWSGHEVSPFPSVAAVALGARIVERHFTLDRTSWGSDQAASLEPKGFAKMVEEIRTVEKALGRPELRLLECEEPSRAKLRRVA